MKPKYIEFYERHLAEGGLVGPLAALTNALESQGTHLPTTAMGTEPPEVASVQNRPIAKLSQGGYVYLDNGERVNMAEGGDPAPTMADLEDELTKAHSLYQSTVDKDTSDAVLGRIAKLAELIRAKPTVGQMVNPTTLDEKMKAAGFEKKEPFKLVAEAPSAPPVAASIPADLDPRAYAPGTFSDDVIAAANAADIAKNSFTPIPPGKIEKKDGEKAPEAKGEPSAKAAEAKPAEAKPAEAKPAEAKQKKGPSVKKKGGEYDAEVDFGPDSGRDTTEYMDEYTNTLTSLGGLREGNTPEDQAFNIARSKQAARITDNYFADVKASTLPTSEAPARAPVAEKPAAVAPPPEAPAAGATAGASKLDGGVAPVPAASLPPPAPAAVLPPLPGAGGDQLVEPEAPIAPPSVLPPPPSSAFGAPVVIPPNTPDLERAVAEQVRASPDVAAAVAPMNLMAPPVAPVVSTKAQELFAEYEKGINEERDIDRGLADVKAGLDVARAKSKLQVAERTARRMADMRKNEAVLTSRLNGFDGPQQRDMGNFLIGLIGTAAAFGGAKDMDTQISRAIRGRNERSVRDMAAEKSNIRTLLSENRQMMKDEDDAEKLTMANLDIQAANQLTVLAGTTKVSAKTKAQLMSAAAMAKIKAYGDVEDIVHKEEQDAHQVRSDDLARKRYELDVFQQALKAPEKLAGTPPKAVRGPAAPKLPKEPKPTSFDATTTKGLAGEGLSAEEFAKVDKAQAANFLRKDTLVITPSGDVTKVVRSPSSKYYYINKETQPDYQKDLGKVMQLVSILDRMESLSKKNSYGSYTLWSGADKVNYENLVAELTLAKSQAGNTGVMNETEYQRYLDASDPQSRYFQNDKKKEWYKSQKSSLATNFNTGSAIYFRAEPGGSEANTAPVPSTGPKVKMTGPDNKPYMVAADQVERYKAAGYTEAE